MGNGIWAIEWSRDRWRHVTPKVLWGSTFGWLATAWLLVKYGTRSASATSITLTHKRFKILTLSLPVSQRSNQQGWATFGAKYGQEGFDRCTQNFKWSGRDKGYRMQKKSFRYLLPFEQNTRTWQTDKQTERQTIRTVTSITISEIVWQRCHLKHNKIAVL